MEQGRTGFPSGYYWRLRHAPVDAPQKPRPFHVWRERACGDFGLSNCRDDVSRVQYCAHCRLRLAGAFTGDFAVAGRAAAFCEVIENRILVKRAARPASYPQARINCCIFQARCNCGVTVLADFPMTCCAVLSKNKTHRKATRI